MKKVYKLIVSTLVLSSILTTGLYAEDNSKEDKRLKLQELRKTSEIKEIEIKARLKLKLEKALNKRFETIEKMNEDRQKEVFERLSENIRKLEDRKQFNGAKATVFDVLKDIVDDRLNSLSRSSSDDFNSSGVKLRGDGSVDDNSSSRSSRDDFNSSGVKLRGDGSVDDNSGSRSGKNR